MPHENYQSKELSLYSASYLKTAGSIFNSIELQLWDGVSTADRCGKKYQEKGSYSIFGGSTPNTLGKIVVYEKSKPNRPAGVYIWIRINGNGVDNIWGETRPERLRGLLERMKPDKDTMSIGPHWNDYFAVIRIEVNDDLRLFQELFQFVARC